MSEKFNPAIHQYVHFVVMNDETGELLHHAAYITAVHGPDCVNLHCLTVPEKNSQKGPSFSSVLRSDRPTNYTWHQRDLEHEPTLLALIQADATHRMTEAKAETAKREADRAISSAKAELDRAQAAHDARLAELAAAAAREEAEAKSQEAHE